jgi:threonine aldolase
MARLKGEGVLLSTTVWPTKLRAVTHLDVTDDDIDTAIDAIPRALGVLARA